MKNYISGMKKVRKLGLVFLTSLILLVTVFNSQITVQAGMISANAEKEQSLGINAAACIVGNSDTGEIYYEQNSLVRRAPASTTKVMTALLTYEAIARGELFLETPVMVSQTAIAGFKTDASHVYPRLKAGEIMTVDSLLKAVMLKSDCYACNVLGEVIAGSVDNFVILMNQRAVELGCVDTSFVNTHGYPAENHFTNAYSLFLIANAAVKYPQFVELIKMTQATIPQTNLTAARTLNTTNELIKPKSLYYNPYAYGMKTGSAKSSGLCLIAAAELGKRKVVSVVLGAEKVNINGVTVNNQFYETNRLLNYGLVY